MLEIVLVIVLAVILIVFVAGFVFEFGLTLSDSPVRCPACGLERLKPRGAVRADGRHQLLLCDQCGAEYREELDGSLTSVSPS